jgi:hypothetical protein
MRVFSQAELARLSRNELSVLLRQIAGELPRLAEGSPQLRSAHFNLTNIRSALAKPTSGRAESALTPARMSRAGPIFACGL